MTLNEILAMAREAGFPFTKYGTLECDEDGEIDADEMFENFAALVAAAEREHLHKSAEAYKSVLEAAQQPQSVPDEQLQAAFERGLKAGNEQDIAQQIEIHKLHDLLATQQQEPPADLVRDAARYRWLLQQAWFQQAADRFDLPDGGLQKRFEKCMDAFSDAAIERDKKGGEA